MLSHFRANAQIMRFFRRPMLHFLGMAAVFFAGYAAGIRRRLRLCARFTARIRRRFFRRLCARFTARIRRRFFRRLCAHFVARIRRRRCLSPLAIRPDDIEILQKAIDVRLSQ